MKVYKMSNGRFGRHPDERSASARIRYRYFSTTFKCTTCNSSDTVYTSNERCVMCQRYAVELTRYYFYNQSGPESHIPWPDHVPHCYHTPKILKEVDEMLAVLRSSIQYSLRSHPCKNHGHVQVSMTSPTDCYQCNQMKGPREEALREGRLDYVASSKCRGCGDITIRHTDTSVCTKCGNDPKVWTPKDTPRNRAIAKGESHYIPDKKCKKCGTLALRAVNNGRCSECSKTKQRSGPTGDTPESVMMREAPDMVISKVEAVAMGLKVYRTGKACKKGHTGFRYISTGNCIDCIKS